MYSNSPFVVFLWVIVDGHITWEKVAFTQSCLCYLLIPIFQHFAHKLTSFVSPASKCTVLMPATVAGNRWRWASAEVSA